jgi:hypothetical protein
VGVVPFSHAYMLSPCSLLLKERVTILEKPKPDGSLSGREPTFLLGGGRNVTWCL